MTPKPHRNGFNYLLLMYMHYIGVYLHRYEPNLKKKLRRFRRFSAALFCIDSIPSLIYIRTSDSRGNVSSFKTQDLGALQKSDPKARKSTASEFIKEKLKKLSGWLSFEGRQTKLRTARAFKLSLK